jgi:hypothetical protein
MNGKGLGKRVGYLTALLWTCSVMATTIVPSSLFQVKEPTINACDYLSYLQCPQVSVEQQTVLLNIGYHVT